MLEPVRDMKGLLTYFTHYKNPEKHQYDESELKANFEIKRTAEDALCPLVVDDLLCSCKNERQFIAELVKRNWTGNAVTNRLNAKKL